MLDRQLRVVRAARGMSQKELVEISGIPRRHISDFENGKTIPTVEMLNKIKAALLWPPVEKAEQAFQLLGISNHGDQESA